MKTAVVYYTRDGSTRIAANVIAEKFGAAVFELVEVKKRGHSTGDFIRAGFGAMIGKRSRLKNDYANKVGAYDRICIGTPVWAGKAAPAVNAFVHSLDASKKQIVIFTLQADKETDTLPGKCAGILKKALEKRGAVQVGIVRLYGAGVNETAKLEDIVRQVDEKLKG